MPQQEKDAVEQSQAFHRLRPGMKEKAWHFIAIVSHIFYAVCYITGVQSMRVARYTGRRLLRVLRPVGRFFYRLFDVILLKRIRRAAGNIASESRRFAGGFPLAFRRIRTGYREHPLRTCGFALALPFLALRRHRRAVFTLLNLAAPVAAVFVLVGTVNYWSSSTFALKVEYDGETLGYISDESVYDMAANMATGRVINTDDSFAVQKTPKMTIGIVSKSDILDEASVCDKILSSSSDSIAEVSGLYIDGSFEGAMESRSDLNALLQSILNGYMNGDESDRAEFVQNVQVIDGLYPVSSVVSTDNMKALLTKQTMVDKYYTVAQGDSPLLIAAKTDMSLDQLRAMNPDFDNLMYPGKQVLVQKAQPFLRVKEIRTVEYTEGIDYDSTTVNDDSQYIGYTKVKTDGQEGEQLIKADVTYLDGVEQSRTVLSTTVTKEPVTKVTVIGSKKASQSVTAAGDGKSTGRFIWPVPSCRMISSPFGYRWGSFHKGIDISGNGVYGKDIIAADGGTVAEVNTSGWGAGYGKYVIIDHGGGYRTMYAHCSSVLVSAGQKVSQGQLIAKVGQSGDATGPHLHFEVRINGTSVNPVTYLK